MSKAGRALIIETVGGTSVPAGLSPPGDAGAFVHLGHGSLAPLEQHVGRSRLFEVVDDPSPSDRPHVAPMTLCTTPLWDEDWLIRVRYEAAGPASAGDTDLSTVIAGDVRAITAAVRSAALTPTFDLVVVGHRRHRTEVIPGPEGEPLATIAEIPLRVRFYE